MTELLTITLRSLQALPKELIVIIISALPVFELRLGLPVAIFVFHFSYPKAIALALIGNMLPVIPLLLFLEPIAAYLVRFRLWKKFFDWLFARTSKKAEMVQKYEALGLALFIGIPLPGTGVWTGCVAASLLKMRFRYGAIASVAGTIIAAAAISILCITGTTVFKP